MFFSLLKSEALSFLKNKTFVILYSIFLVAPPFIFQFYTERFRMLCLALGTVLLCDFVYESANRDVRSGAFAFFYNLQHSFAAAYFVKVLFYSALIFIPFCIVAIFCPALEFFSHVPFLPLYLFTVSTISVFCSVSAPKADILVFVLSLILSVAFLVGLLPNKAIWLQCVLCIIASVIFFCLAIFVSKSAYFRRRI